MKHPHWLAPLRSNRVSSKQGDAGSRRASFEPLEPRLVLTVSLQSGPVPDNVVLYPDSPTGVYQIAADPLNAEDLAMIDLSVITEADQRHRLPSQSGPLVKVDTAQRYVLSLRTFNTAREFEPDALRIDSFDVDKNQIEAVHVTKHAFAIDTTLAAALNLGDTSVLIDNASGWSNSPTESAETRALAWYGYADSDGNIYADFTYTRNVAVDTEHGLWEPGAIRYDNATGAYRIGLLQPWSGPAIAAGTAIRNATAAESSVDYLLDDSFVPSKFNFESNWAEFRTSFGAGEWSDGKPSARFLPGTAYIRPDIFLPATEVVISPEQDLAFGEPSDPARPTLGVGSDHRLRMELDVLSKGALPSFTPGMAGNFDNDDNLDGSDFLLWQHGPGSTHDAADLLDWQENYGSIGTVVLASVETPVHGAAQLITNTNGQLAIDYLSAPWFVGTDVVQYTLRNTTSGQTFEGSVTIEVLGGNVQQDPGTVAVLNSQAQVVIDNAAPEKLYGDVGYVTAPGLKVVGDDVRNLDLLAYMRDPVDELVVRLLDGPNDGALNLNYDGSFEYVPDTGFVGQDNFRYEVFDGLHSTFAVASIQVLESDDALAKYRMKEIALAMLDYSLGNNRFPGGANFDGGGNPLLSWRVQILPYLEFQSLYNQFNFDEAWNSSTNLPLLSQMPDVFRSPGDPLASTGTRFQTFTGPGAPFGRLPAGMDQIGPRNFDFADGLDHTILLAEAGANQLVPWTKPDDLEFNVSDPLGALGDFSGNKFNVFTAGGELLTLATSISADDFKALVTPNGEEIVDAGTLARQYREQNGETETDPSLVDASENSRFREIGLGILHFENSTGRLPYNLFDSDDGSQLLSWRVAILPYLGHTNLYEQFHRDEPWDSPHNLALMDEMPDIYRSADESADTSSTRIQFIVDDSEQPQVGFLRPPRFAGDRWRELSFNLAAFRDGISNTIGFVEAGTDKAVPWTMPTDLLWNHADPIASFGQLPGNEFRAGMLDGQPLLISSDTNPEILTALASRADGMPLDAEKLHSKQQQASGVISYTYHRQNDLQRLVLGMLNYQDAHRRFPGNRTDTAGNSLLSWRVQILPYLEHQNLYQLFHQDEPWDSPHNLSLLKYMPDVFRSSGDPLDSTTTRVKTFTGENAPFAAPGDASQLGPRFQDITDGSSNTIAIVEAGEGTAVAWTKPVDLEYYENNPYSVLGELGNSFLAAFMDGHVDTLSSVASLAELKARITHQGGEDLNELPEFTANWEFYINQSGGDTVLNEFGVDTFDVVLDRAPTSNVEIILSVNDTLVADVDQQTVTFTPENWSVPQRVALRAVDNFALNEDQTVQVLAVVNPLASDFNYTLSASVRSFSATIVDDDLTPGDFNRSGTVDDVDLGAWQAAYGQDDGADADRDGDSDGRDFLAWQRNRTVIAPANASIASEHNLLAPVLATALHAETDEKNAVPPTSIHEQEVATHQAANAPLAAAAAEWEHRRHSLDEDALTDETDEPWLTDELLERVFG